MHLKVIPAHHLALTSTGVFEADDAASKIVAGAFRGKGILMLDQHGTIILEHIKHLARKREDDQFRCPPLSAESRWAVSDTTRLKNLISRIEKVLNG